MKRASFLISCLTLLTINAFAQQTISATNAVKHIGEQVIVADAVYNIKAYNDSTAVIDLGGKDLKAPLNVVLSFNSKVSFDYKFLKNFKDARIAVTGFIVLVDNQPAIVLTEKQKLKFLSGEVNKKWLALSAISPKESLSEK
ncbi:MAG TPA: hypothetical protein VGI43_07200 [Mucilaginibacter sp.]|jgi:actin-related protein